MHNQKQWHAIAIIDPIALAIAIHAQVIKCSIAMHMKMKCKLYWSRL